MLDDLLKKVVGSEVRRLLAVACGALLAAGLLTPEQAAAFADTTAPVVIAALLYGLSSVWGLIKNSKVQKIEEVAKDVAPFAVDKIKGKI